MKKEFLENLFKDLEMEENTKKGLIKSILDENGNDINNEKAKTEGVKNDLKVKNALIDDLNAKIKEADSVDIEALKKEQFDLGKAEGSKEVEEFKKTNALKSSIKGAKDFDLVYSKLDKDKIKYEKNDKGEYTVSGIDEQIKDVKEKYSFLFEEEDDGSSNTDINLGGKHENTPPTTEFDFGFTPIHPVEKQK